MIGHQVGAYRLKHELGHGAFGTVYEADEEFDGRAFARVAIKIICPRDAKHRASLVGELTTLANFRHPHIVGYRAFGELPPEGNGQLAPIYIATELAEGGTLAARYRKQCLSPRQLLELARDVAGGLAFIAQRGWTHRDIKPDNILCFEADARAQWKISDLGLARPTALSDAIHDPSGTMHYMAPEAWRGVVAPSNDVWALGLCIREAATGQRLWEEVAKGALPHVVNDTAHPIDFAALPAPLQAITRGCLEREPSKRWSAAQVAARAEQELTRLPPNLPVSLMVSQTGQGHYTSIRAALDAAPDGAHIAIFPGIYEESLVIKRDVSLAGFDPHGGEARDSVIITGATANALRMSGGQALLSSLTLRGNAQRNGPKFHTVTISEARVRFQNCRISSESLGGMQAGKNAHATLTQCRIEGAATEGILAQDNARVVLEAVRISKCGCNGIAAQTSSRLEARRVVVSGCKENGVYLGAGTVAYLLGCKFTGNTRNGVRAENAALARIESCEARNNGYGAWEIPIRAEVTRVNTQPN